jgi:phosphoglycerate dehydrogenase-like enzyme
LQKSKESSWISNSAEGLFKVANNLVAIEPKSFPEYERAIGLGGGNFSPMSPQVRGLIWTDYSSPEALGELIDSNPQLEWVQLPFAGVDAFAEQLGKNVLFTSAKGAYREPVAEHALTLALALGRKIPIRVKASSWGKSEAFSFYDSKVLLIGAGGISEELVKLLLPFRAEINVVRNNPALPFAGAKSVVGLDKLDSLLPDADLVIVTCALTEQTRGLINYRRLSLFKSTAYLVNIARGPIVVSEDLLRALDEGLLAAAGLDVTDPEPLPDGHAFFGRDDLILTPHTADTKEIVTRLFAARIEQNVKAFLGKGQWIGEVSPDLGY